VVAPDVGALVVDELFEEPKVVLSCPLDVFPQPADASAAHNARKVACFRRAAIMRPAEGRYAPPAN
jgi:hypothetical protein